MAHWHCSRAVCHPHKPKRHERRGVSVHCGLSKGELSRSFRDHHRDLVVCRIDDHDIILDDDVAEGR